MPPRTTRPDHRLRLGLTLLLVLQAAGAWLPATWLWGLDHLAWCPVPVRVLVPLIGLVVVWAPFDRPAIRLATLVGERLLNNRVLTYGLLPACGAVAGWLLRDRIHMLGDGLTLSGMLAIDRLFHGFDLMTYHLVARLRQLAGGGDELAAMQTFAIVSWVCGAAWVATAGWAARNLTRHATGRLLLYGLLLFFTPVQLFLGYVEAYAPLAVALLAFFTSVLLYWRGQVRLIVVAATWSVGLFCHLNALFVAPLLLAVLLRPGPGESDPWSQRLLTLVWPPLAALALVVLAYLAAGYDLAALRHDFAHFGEGEGVLVSLSGRDGLLNWRHWKDVLNGVLLLVPLPVLLLTTTRTRDAVRSPSCPHTGWLVGVSGWLLVLLAALHLKLGAPRDWDLLAPHMSLVVLAAWCRVAEDKTGTLFSAAEVIRVLVVVLVLCAPWFGLNADAGRSLDRIQAVSADLAPFPHGLVHEQLANHLRYHDDVTGEAHHLAQASRICPGNPRFSMAYAGHLLKQGHRTEGLAVLDDILARDPDYVPALKLVAIARLIQEDYDGALIPARRLQALQAQDVESARAHGDIAKALGLNDEAIAAYRRSLAVDPSQRQLLWTIAELYYFDQRYGDAEPVFRLLVRHDPNRTKALIGLAECIWHSYIARYPEGTPVPAADHDLAARRLNEALQLIDRVLPRLSPDDPQVPRYRQWQTLIRARLAEVQTR